MRHGKNTQSDEDRRTGYAQDPRCRIVAHALLFLTFAILTPVAHAQDSRLNPPRNLRVASRWSPPIGIPSPKFGISQSHTMYETSKYDFGSGAEAYPDAGHGPYTHFVDNTHDNASDSDNPFGSPTRPRETPPQQLPAGSVVEIHGGPYNLRNLHDKFSIDGHGTAEKPAFFRGVSSEDSPLITKTITYFGNYVIMENLTLRQGAGVSIRDYIDEGVSNLTVRNCDMQGTGTFNESNAISVAGDQIVIYNNDIRDYGDWEALSENDVMGVVVGSSGTNVWVIDNQIHHVGGDSVQVGQNNPPISTHHVYVGRNDFHHNGENAIDIKVCRDVVMSENRLHGIYGNSDSSSGEVVVIHYHPVNIWFLYNEIFDSVQGVVCTGADPVYYIGNVFHDIKHSGSYDPDSVYARGIGLHVRGGGNHYVLSNTFYDLDKMIAVANGSVHVISNILVNLTSANEGYMIHMAYSDSATSSQMHHNLVYQQGGSARFNWGGDVLIGLDSFRSEFPSKGDGSVEADPMFVDAASALFRLRSESPANGMGVSHPAYNTYQGLYGVNIKVDRTGARRIESEWEAGAYEIR